MLLGVSSNEAPRSIQRYSSMEHGRGDKYVASFSSLLFACLESLFNEIFHVFSD